MESLPSLRSHPILGLLRKPILLWGAIGASSHANCSKPHFMRGTSSPILCSMADIVFMCSPTGKVHWSNNSYITKFYRSNKEVTNPTGFRLELYDQSTNRHANRHRTLVGCRGNDRLL